MDQRQIGSEGAREVAILCFLVCCFFSPSWCYSRGAEPPRGQELVDIALENLAIMDYPQLNSQASWAVDDDTETCSKQVRDVGQTSSRKSSSIKWEIQLGEIFHIKTIRISRCSPEAVIPTDDATTVDLYYPSPEAEGQSSVLRCADLAAMSAAEGVGCWTKFACEHPDPVAFGVAIWKNSSRQTLCQVEVLGYQASEADLAKFWISVNKSGGPQSWVIGLAAASVAVIVLLTVLGLVIMLRHLQKTKTKGSGAENEPDEVEPDEAEPDKAVEEIPGGVGRQTPLELQRPEIAETIDDYTIPPSQYAGSSGYKSFSECSSFTNATSVSSIDESKAGNISDTRNVRNPKNLRPYENINMLPSAGNAAASGLEDRNQHGRNVCTDQFGKFFEDTNNAGATTQLETKQHGARHHEAKQHGARHHEAKQHGARPKESQETNEHQTRILKPQGNLQKGRTGHVNMQPKDGQCDGYVCMQQKHVKRDGIAAPATGLARQANSDSKSPLISRSTGNLGPKPMKMGMQRTKSPPIADKPTDCNPAASYRIYEQLRKN